MTKKPMTKAKSKGVKAHEDVGTTGHSYDGIEEFNNPLPSWWVWTFYVTIFWAIVYSIAYPAWPLVKEATPGLLGWSTRANVAEEIAAFEAKNADLDAALAAADLSALESQPELLQYANSNGAAVFRTWCAQCHGAGAQGAKGYPNLLDDDWLWGGTIEDIHTTITHGIRNETDPDARYSQMPAYGEIFSKEEITQVVAYARSLSGQEVDHELAHAGETLFMDNCAACHGEAGTGDIYQGAPDLTDAIWLYGGDEATVTETVTNARFGVMPSWQDRLLDPQIAAVAVYVHGLGGGE